MKAIITIPHADCSGKAEGHRCDFSAERFGDLVYDVFLERGIPASIFRGDVPRDVIDLNRRASRRTRFRRALRKELKQAGFNDVLLDIHSFPGDIFPFEVYFLDIAEIGMDDAFNGFLRNELKKEGIKVSVVEKGSLDNDIVIEAMLDHGLSDASLIEINENLDVERLKIIAIKLVGAVIAYRQLNEWSIF